ncbi:PHD finger protein 3 [Sesamum alatum]|uniref:PHD finger protein 3 n=1 Tax=Sesamum alatum TaxID=300844 RepID=A0AAE2CFC3_9LAMI|nr:PHD finger protein 3 [Sesamum alatum]
MSNNLVSQYPISDRHVVQMEHHSNSLDLPVSELHMKMSSNPESHQFYGSTEKMGLVDPVSSNPGFNMIPNNSMGLNESSGGSMGSNPIWMSDQLGHEDSCMLTNMAGEKTSFPVKRKAEMVTVLNNSISQQSVMPNKRSAQMGDDFSSLGFLQTSAPQRRNAPAQTKLASPGVQAQPSVNKKMVRNDSISGKSGLQRVQTTKKQTAQIESASKVRPEPSEAVRPKMRESLAAALALAFPNQDNVSNTEKKQSDSVITHQTMDLMAPQSNSIICGQVPAAVPKDVSPSKDLAAPGNTNDCQGFFSAELPSNASDGNDGQSFQEFQYSSVLPDEDISFGDNFFGKDDLLQGNGLSWAFDFDVQMREGKDAQPGENPKSVKEEDQGLGGELAILTPEKLAFKIEAELFKLHGGVNKKYREKGRSLLFNLKDRNNPDLRERVMSGEILPERLCSMSAEELASKELSEWRMAKAEEFAQMVVLPDTEVDIRRLVRKTHKGEYQVEVERDDGIAAEVSGGTSMFTQPQRKKEIEPHSPSEGSLKDKDKVSGQDSHSEDKDFSGSLIIPTDGTDLMQGMIVDELKDAEFLPPIVSLDEFMESLNSEPPFEDLSSDAKTPVSHGESPKAGNSLQAQSRTSDSPKDASSKKAGVVKKHEVDVTMRSGGSPVKHKVVPSTASKVEYIWDGILQLSISSSVTVGGLFQSGEKTSMKEWPSSLEIKGRVRLDAFEKFLQDLPMSRTRAVMVLHFVLRDKSSEADRSQLSEAIESYIADERLGYAEPAPGVELYLCPPTLTRITDMLNKHVVAKDRPDTHNSIENGLIGVVVWRRAHLSNTISPNSSSHHKHSSKKHPFSAPKRAQDSSNVNATRTMTTSPPVSTKSLPPQTEEDDDIPPGFGPVPAAKDDDDLPEFSFSGNIKNPSVARQDLHHGVRLTHRPVDQVRELIKKYGQSSTSRSLADDRNLGIEPWNDDDDDDDIPEWRPQAQQHQPPYPVAHGQRPPVHLLSGGHPMAPVSAQQLPSGLGQLPPGGRWIQPPPGPLRGARWRHH